MSVSTDPPSVVRQLTTPGARSLVNLVETFDDLQMVLGCCERLMTTLTAPDDDPDEVVTEALWTMALLSYTRCFAVRKGGAILTEQDLAKAQPGSEVLDWHRVLLKLRDHYSDPAVNPRERFSVGVAQDATGGAGGVAITSTRQPLVDDLTVRQTGAIAFALTGLVNDRIEAQQQKVFHQLKNVSKADLEKLEEVAVAQPERTRQD